MGLQHNANVILVAGDPKPRQSPLGAFLKSATDCCEIRHIQQDSRNSVCIAHVSHQCLENCLQMIEKEQRPPSNFPNLNTMEISCLVFTFYYFSFLIFILGRETKNMKIFRLTEAVRERKIHVINTCNCKSHTKRRSLMFGYLMRIKYL